MDRWLHPRLALLILLIWCGNAHHASAQPYDQAPDRLRVMTWNVEWMYDSDTRDNRSRLSLEKSLAPDYWEAKLSGVARGLAQVQPDIIALQEIEGRSTLQALIDRLRSKHHLSYREAFIEGRDSFTEQDVGLLYRAGLVSYRRQEQSRAMFDSQQYYNLSKHLIAEFRWGNVQRPLTLLNVHFRATAEAEDKRIRQARLARLWMESSLQAGQAVLVLGDLNCEYPAGVLRAELDVLAAPASHQPLVDLLSVPPASAESTHLVLDKQFDRILASKTLLEDEPGADWVFEQIEVLPDLAVQGKRDGQPHWDGPAAFEPDELDFSDHAPVVATFILK